MSYIDYLLIAMGVAFFYLYHFKKLHGHMPIPSIALYSTLKGLILLIIPFVAMLFASNILSLGESSVWMIVAAAFLIVFVFITISEDRKTGVIKEIIDKANDDFYKK